MKTGWWVISMSFTGLGIFLLLSCGNERYKPNESHKYVSLTSIKEGEQAAKRYCQSCHMLPDPSLLSSKKWETGVLPQMGPKLGVFAYGSSLYPSLVNDTNIGPSFYPSAPVMNFTDWQNIIDYYTSLSPDSLEADKNDVKIEISKTLFTPVNADSSFSYPAPVTGALLLNDKGDMPSLLIADLNTGKVFSADDNAKMIDSVIYSSPVSAMVLQGDTLISANIGMPNPNDGKSGSVQQLIYQNGKFVTTPAVLDSNLRRPVHIDVTDINRDGWKDILVCEFGNLKGAFSWLENKGNNRYDRHVIKAQPGAIATVVRDFNHDGLPDVYVLFAQGDEQLVRFENKGGGRFEERQLLRFPPVYGSSYFEMKDVNKDGFDDIIYTCGDNADYSVELKPYHGVYIFINNGDDHFTQRYFFHINGCFKAMADDFDNDGDADIAVISFFADYKNRPEESFVYLKNEGGFHFSPYSVPAATEGRWISMDVGDINKDGKPDILLGNFSFSSFIPSPVNWKKKPAFLLLKNNIF